MRGSYHELHGQKQKLQAYHKGLVLPLMWPDALHKRPRWHIFHWQCNVAHKIHDSCVTIINSQRQLEGHHRIKQNESAPQIHPTPSIHCDAPTSDAPYMVHVVHGTAISHIKVTKETTVDALLQEWCNYSLHSKPSVSLTHRDKVISSHAHSLLTEFSIQQDSVLHAYTRLQTPRTLEHKRALKYRNRRKESSQKQSVPQSTNDTIPVVTKIGRVIVPPSRLWR